MSASRSSDEHELAAIHRSRRELQDRWYREGCFKRESLAQSLLRANAAKPPSPLYFQTEQGWQATTTAEVLAEGQRLASALQAIGIRPGDVLAIQMPTRHEAAVIYIACFFAGAVLLPIVHIYGPAEVSFILRRSRARALFIPDRWRKIDFLERLAGLGTLPDLEHIIVIGDRLPAGATRFDALRSKVTGAMQPPAQEADDTCLLLFTSGTTGESKGVRQTHNTLRYEYEIPYPELPDLHLNPFPAGHIAGFNILMRPFFTGMPLIMMDGWDAALAAQLIERHGVIQSGGAPYFLLTLLEAAQRGGHDISSLKNFALGGTTVTPEHVYLADRHGIISGRGYGMTEHSTVAQYKLAMPLERRATTEGWLMPRVEARVVDDDDKEVSPGLDGEILLRGPEQSPGYLDPKHDLPAFTHDGWYRSGDIGRIDAEGYITITDRKKDIIIRGGENISSMEVENVLLGLPQVSEVAVVAMPDPKYGEKVCAYVIARQGAQLSLEDVALHCDRAGFARQKTPERLILVDDMPRTASGKVKKAELRARLRASNH